MISVNIDELERLLIRFEDDGAVFGIYYTYLLDKRALALAPSVYDKEGPMDRRELLGVYRLEEAYQHELPVILPPHIIAEHRKLQIRNYIHLLEDSPDYIYILIASTRKADDDLHIL